MIKYFIRLLKGTENPILDEAFQCAKTIETQWYQSVESLLKVNGFAYVVQDDRTLDDTNFPLIFKQRCTDIYFQNSIVSKMRESNKLGFYYDMTMKGNDKTQYKHQSYLETVKNMEHKTSITRLRCSAHIFEEEKGRHMNVLREERLCNQCNSLEMEDLVHFIMKCNAYQNERADLIHILKESYKRNYNKMTDMEKCSKLLSMEIKPQLIDKCAATIHFIYKKRRKANKSKQNNNTI